MNRPKESDYASYYEYTRALVEYCNKIKQPETEPISDVTEAVTRTVIEVEKLLCEKLGREWQASGMSIQTLVDELASLAQPKLEPAASVCMDVSHHHMMYNGQYIGQKPNTKTVIFFKDLDVGTLLYAYPKE